MIIGSSMVTMRSERTYSATDVMQYATVMSHVTEESPLTGDFSQDSALLTQAGDGTTDDEALAAEDSLTNPFDAYLSLRRTNATKDGLRTTIRSLDELRMYLLEQLTRSLEERRFTRCPWDNNPCMLTRDGDGFATLSAENSRSLTQPVYLSNMYRVQTVQSHFYSEKEVTSFASEGTVRTADGREISFGIQFEMSRSYETFDAEYSESVIKLCDPLVINYGGNVAELTDQYFCLDLDGDGEKEQLRQLAKNSGLLSLDLNGDGIIDDGTELFGTSSGNGFADLAAYDEDSNGWIDEADSVFGKLSVLVKNDDGTDTLLTLKQAGVGAISLDSVQSDFALKDETNSTLAQIRRSGIFLYEDGGVGTVQQMDYAI